MKRRRQKGGSPLFRARNREQMLEQARFLVMRPNKMDRMLLKLLLSPRDSLEPFGPLAGPNARPNAGDKPSS
jgi:hypothetical protein